MNGDAAEAPAVSIREVCKSFRRASGDIARALEGVSLEARRGSLTALVGPDGAGKTTLIRLLAGLMPPDAGELHVAGIDVRSHPQRVQSILGYMPQRFGLYEDLTVQENLDLYADLHGVERGQRRERFPQLMAMTALGPFTRRLAGRLSGGMKQKLGLACTLVRSPELLLLDEPTVGIDPLSRRELWNIVARLVEEQGLTVLLSTSYLDEAERCGHAIVLHEGRILVQGPPAEVRAIATGHTLVTPVMTAGPARALQQRLLDDPLVVDAVPEGGRVRIVTALHQPGRTGADAEALMAAGATTRPAAARFEDGFMMLLRQKTGTRHPTTGMTLEHPPGRATNETVVQVSNLVRRFGSFTAVDDISFEIRRGEIFGLLGPNGAGKTTTFRMLCGLLSATSGTLRVAGVDVRQARASARQRIGYVAQKFSLYGQLTVLENLQFFASAYNLRGRGKRARVEWAMEQFELSPLAGLPSGQLPGGFKQRLAMAAALLHEPEILFLDEPTSGADPLARREFWRRITALAQQHVTIIVTTHFMEEAEYCDRVVILETGRVLAAGSPAEVRAHAPLAAGREPTMEDAFIAIVEESRARPAAGGAWPGGAA